MLTGKLTRLREYRETDLAVLTEMMNDEKALADTTRGIITPLTAAMVRAHFAAGEDQQCFHYMVEDRSGSLIGFIEIENHFKDRRCQLSFQIRPAEQGKGYGSDALELILAMAFMEMNMNKCTTTILAFNAAALTVLTKAGFKKEVTLREDVYRGGTFHDAFVMGMLREDYTGRKAPSKVCGDD